MLPRLPPPLSPSRDRRSRAAPLLFSLIYGTPLCILFLAPSLTKHSFHMVKHIILWTLDPAIPEARKMAVKRDIKDGLESLVGKIPGLRNAVVHISGRLETSNCDVMLDSTFDNAEALASYAKHPLHVGVADSKVRPFTIQRTCLDFVVEE